MAQIVQATLDLPFRVVVYPAPDLEGQWVGHCLELDLVSQGDSPDHALRMVNEAVIQLYAYNVQHGLMPLQLHPAPAEVWQAFGIEQPENIQVKLTLRISGIDDDELKPDNFAPRFESHVSEKPPAYAAAG